MNALLDTLAIYKGNNLPYYGGGTNAEEARQPVLMEVNGNKIAFMGCNGKRAGNIRKPAPPAPARRYVILIFLESKLMS